MRLPVDLYKVLYLHLKTNQKFTLNLSCLMKKQLLIIAGIAMIVAACSGLNKEHDESTDMGEMIPISKEQAFLDNLRSLCGLSFKGRETFVKEGRESWADNEFVMHVTVCEEEEVHIPFHVGEDQSRTWLFIVEDSRLRFRHDHRYEDGTPEDTTLYGGYSDNRGTNFVQYFPEDQYTIDLLSDNYVRQWNVILSEDLSTFTYELHVNGELFFAVEFDLTSP